MEEVLRSLIDDELINQVKLFGVDFDTQFQSDLDSQRIPTDLPQVFEDNGIAFPSNPTVWVQLKGGEWQITNENKKYTLKEEDNQLDVYDNRWIAVKDVGEINVPDSLEQMMGARIDKMEDQSKAVLQNGSVIGRTFEYDILEGISQGLGNLEAHLSQLNALDMVVLRMPPTDPPEYIFGHLVTHNIAYSAIPGVRRRGLHSQVGDCMEAKHQEHLERVHELLAQHYHDGNDPKKAVTYLAQAGTKAKRQFNNKVALTFYQQGLEHLKQLSEDLPEEQRTIHEGLGDVYTILGEFDAAVENYTETLQSAPDAVHRAALKRKMAEVYEKRSEFDVAMENLNAALEDLKIQPDPEEEARIHNALGSIHSKKGEFATAIEITERALKLVENTTVYDVIAAIDKNLGIYYLRTRNVERGREYFEKGIERAERIGDKMLMAQLYNNLGMVGQMTGQMDVAVDNLQKSVQIKEQLGDAVGMATSYSNLGMISSATGTFDRALEYYDKASTIAQCTGAQERVATEGVGAQKPLKVCGVCAPTKPRITPSCALSSRGKNLVFEPRFKVRIPTVLNVVGKILSPDRW